MRYVSRRQWIEGDDGREAGGWLRGSASAHLCSGVVAKWRARREGERDRENLGT